MKNGEIVHYLPPEYHGDRIRGRGKVLAFRNYGMAIRDKLESVGFTVTVVTVTDHRYAIPQAKVIRCYKD